MAGSGTKKKTTALTPAEKQAAALAAALNTTLGGLTGALSASSGSASGNSIPDVTKSYAGQTVSVAAPQQTPVVGSSEVPLRLPAAAQALLAKDSSGGATTSGENWVQMLHLIFASNRQLYMQIQNQLFSGGWYGSSVRTPPDYSSLDTRTVHAWQQLGLAAANTGISATSLLDAAANAPTLIQDMNNIKYGVDQAKQKAAEITNQNVTLTDQNEVAQRFASAWESLGLGAPTQAQVQKFVTGFHGAEVAASVNEANAEKQNILASAGDYQKALQAIQRGDMTNAQADMAAVGPVTAATKASPNLDAEAMAAAKASNPGAYYAEGASNMYGIFQEMLNGGMQMPTSSSPPSAQGMGGAVVTAPALGGAM